MRGPTLQIILGFFEESDTKVPTNYLLKFDFLSIRIFKHRSPINYRTQEANSCLPVCNLCCFSYLIVITVQVIIEVAVLLDYENNVLDK